VVLSLRASGRTADAEQQTNDLTAITLTMVIEGKIIA
jgi:hypothetical protein